MSRRKPPPDEPRPPLRDEAPLPQVVLWLAEGSTPAMITEALAEQHPGADAAALIVAARERICAVASQPIDRGWLRVALEELHRRAMTSGELSVALRALQQLAKWRPPQTQP